MAKARGLSRNRITVDYDATENTVNVMLPDGMRMDEAAQLLERARVAAQKQAGRPQIFVPRIALPQK